MPTLTTPLALGTAATKNTGTSSGDIPLLSTGGVLPIGRLATGTPDGTKFVRDDGTLAAPPGGSASFVGARAYRTTNQTISSGTYTAVSFDGETYDSGTIHSTSTNSSRFTVPTTGKYLCTAAVIFNANGSGQRQVRFAINGTAFEAGMPGVPSAGVYATFSVTDVLSLTAGDYVELLVYQDSGGNLDIFAGNPGPVYMAVALMGS